MSPPESITYADPTDEAFLLTIAAMETSKERPAPRAEWFNPLSGWEAASRWNRATFDWMAKGWQQWVALMTTVPPHFIVPPTREASRARLRADDVARAAAKGEPRRSATKKAAAKGRKRS